MNSVPVAVPAVDSVIVTRQDQERLGRLLESCSERDRDAADELEVELTRATSIEASSVPPDVVTMNSRIEYEDVASGSLREVSLVYPRDADSATGRISILSAIGTALLGLRVGQSIRWRLPNGQERELRVRRVIYQPEAAGDFHL